MTLRTGSRLLLFALASLGPMAPSRARDDAPALFPEGYLDADALDARLRELAEAHPDAVRLRSIATSGEGRDVWLVTLGEEPGEDPKDRPPAVLIVANLEADHVVGSQVALGLVERLAGEDGGDEAMREFLDDHTLYVVPRLNPDGADRLFEEPRRALHTNLSPTDEDRDARADEDGPDDLDDDGLILRMRAKDEDATLVPDDDDPRILRPAEAAEGERPAYSEYDEGTDEDGDGTLNEDPEGGVNLNRNWPHDWTELTDAAGFSPAGEPEVFGLIRFCYDHPEIAAVWTFTLHDSLRTEPKKPGTTLADADLPYFVELSKAYRKLIAPPKPEAEADGEAEPDADDEPAEDPETPEEPAPIVDGDDPLAAVPEAMRDRVIEAFEGLPAEEQDRLLDEFNEASPLGRARMLAQFLARIGAGEGAGEGETAEAGEEEEEEEDEAEPRPSPGGGPAPAASSALGATTDGAMSEWAYHQFGAVAVASSLWPEPSLPEPAEGESKPPADGEARWLYWNDEVMGGRAFVPFDEVEHPTLGTVEVGGWLPGVRVNPPIGEVEAITEVQRRFLADLVGRLASLAIVDAKAEAKGAGVFEVTARVENPGSFPTALAQGVTTRQAPPVLVRPRLGEARLLAGPTLDRIDALEGSGGSREYRWLILAPDGVDSIELEASCPRAGRVVETIELP
ncbi:M14 family zinc carboxypeptidase [Tautonia plasticadhaerens]|uniref:Carboxypeptidase T n=1 Tax=Tautonia plasticadhaerens TaxID=2527974 RepID=A0A518HBZ5_9BACT|nr:M14 family zinc carboxypeptidase [Tautonia plasticadhaerens]QDV38388.1 Carboxypeptidase T precursor [Tautonia plasticadhaerens]